MKSKLVTKIFLDIVMSIVFVVLLDAFGTGLAFHETAGLLLFGLFMTHIILNWSWVKNTTKKLLQRNRVQTLQASVKLKYFLNLSLFVCITMIVVTGILISKVVFPAETIRSEWLYPVHKWTSYLCLGFLVFHTAIHGRYLVCAISKILSEIKSGSIRKPLVRLGAVAVITFVLLSRVILNFSASDEAKLAENNDPALTSSQYTSSRSESVSESTSYYSSDGEETTTSQNRNASTDDVTSSITSDSTIENVITLTEYLSDQYCTACHDHCSLLNLRCDKGQRQLQQAREEYQELYEDIS